MWLFTAMCGRVQNGNVCKMYPVFVSRGWHFLMYLVKQRGCMHLDQRRLQFTLLEHERDATKRCLS